MFAMLSQWDGVPEPVLAQAQEQEFEKGFSHVFLKEKCSTIPFPGTAGLELLHPSGLVPAQVLTGNDHSLDLCCALADLHHHPLSITDTAVPEQLPLPSEEPQPEEHKPQQPQTEADQGQVVLGKLRVSSVTPGSVQLQWSVPKGSFDSFTLQYRDAQGQPQALAVDGGSRLVTVPGLSLSHWYHFHLYGQTAHPQAETSPSEAPLARAVVGELRVSSVSPDSVQLQWSILEGSLDSFTLQYRDAQGQPQALPIDGGS